MPPVQLINDQGLHVERRQRRVSAASEDVYAVFTGLGGNGDGSMPTGCGDCVALPTGLWAGRACAVAAAIRMSYASETRWTSAR